MPNPTSRRPYIYLPDGTALPLSSEDAPPPDQMAWIDKTITFGEQGQHVSFTPEQILLAAARMLRDGMSLKAIFTELDLDPREVSYGQLERAITRVGMPRLERLIAEGKEPAESQIEIDRDLLPINVNEEEE